MDESSLRAQLNNLDALRSSLHSSFRFWDWVVVAGVTLEFIVLGVEYCDEWRAFWRATIRLPEKPKTWLFLVGFCGIAMVAGGIAKELQIDSQIEGVETQIRGVNEQLFGIVSKEAEDASTKSQLAQGKSDDAVAKSSYASGLAEQTTEIEENRMARHLSNDQKAEIGEALKNFSTHGAYFTYPQDNAEASDFMEDIKSAVVGKARWGMLGSSSQVVILSSGPEPSSTQIVPIPPPLTGVFVVYSLSPGAVEKSPYKAAHALACELSKRGFDAVEEPDIPSMGVSDVYVRVGLRPKGPQGAVKLKRQKKSKNQNKQNNCR